MRSKNCIGLIFANTHDERLGKLTQRRSIASVPFGSRYRMIDFTLSNLVNAGISQVGVVTKENYRSLMDHLTNGKAWELDRKKGGLFIIPPFSNTTYRRGSYHGRLDALESALTFLTRSKQEYVLLCDSDLVGNLDIAPLLADHLSSGADFTVAYRHGSLPKSNTATMRLDLGENSLVTGARFESENETDDYCLGMTVTRRELLVDLICQAIEERKTSYTREILMPCIAEGRVRAFRFEGAAEVIDSIRTYYNVSMKLLEPRFRRQLFDEDRPVYTKPQDLMPTRYGLAAKAKNSLIADGCRIEGTVENSIIFRGVTIENGAVVRNCIVLQNCVIEKNADLCYAILDKGSGISESYVVHGTRNNLYILGKDEKI